MTLHRPDAQPIDPTAEKLYSASEVAKMFSVSTETVRDWIAADKLPGAFRPGGSGQWKIPHSAVVGLAQHNYGGSDGDS